MRSISIGTQWREGVWPNTDRCRRWIVQQAACIVGQLGKLMAVAPCSSTRCGEDVGLSGRCGELLAAAQRVATVCMVVCR